jgi:hypothetical protein
MGGRIGPESVAGLDRNGWPDWTGIRRQELDLRRQSGRPAVFAQFGRYGDEAGHLRDSVSRRVRQCNGRVIGLHHNTGERMGEKLDLNQCIVFEVKDGRIMDGPEQSDLYAWDEF